MKKLMIVLIIGLVLVAALTPVLLFSGALAAVLPWFSTSSVQPVKMDSDSAAPIVMQTETPVQDPVSAPNEEVTPDTIAVPEDPTACVGAGTLFPDVEGWITYQNITFLLDPSIADHVEVAECPAVPYADGQYPGEAHPAYVSFSFPTSRVRIYFQPELRVYQIEGDMGQYLYPMNSLPELRDVLNQQALPINWWNGAHLATNRSYLNFASGEGVRGLVEFSQDYFFYNNNDLVYQYDGLSTSDQYYVNLTYPVAAPFLLDMYGSDPTTNLNRDAISVPEWPESYEAQTEIIRAYNEEALKRFEQLPDEGYDPSLKLLDAMMQSLTIVTQ